MRTNIEIDDRLMKEAMRASGAATKREAVERALQLLVRATEREKLIRETAETLPAEMRDDLRTLLNPLIARKQEHFAENRRGIVNFELTMRPTGPYLSVISTLGA